MLNSFSDHPVHRVDWPWISGHFSGDFSPAQRIRRGFGRCSSSLSGNDEEHHWKDAPTWEKVGVVASGTSKPQGKKGDLRAVTKYLGSGLHVLRDMRGVAWRLAPQVMKLNFNDPSTTQSLPSSLSTTHHRPAPFHIRTWLHQIPGRRFKFQDTRLCRGSSRRTRRHRYGIPRPPPLQVVLTP